MPFSKKATGFGETAKATFGDQNNCGMGSLCLFSRTYAKGPNCILVGLGAW